MCAVYICIYEDTVKYTNVGQVVITMTAKTIVEYTAEHEGYRCGYCQSPNTKYTHGLCSAASICDHCVCS